jgi:hypothetical protein
MVVSDAEIIGMLYLAALMTIAVVAIRMIHKLEVKLSSHIIRKKRVDSDKQSKPNKGSYQ